MHCSPYAIKKAGVSLEFAGPGGVRVTIRVLRVTRRVQWSTELTAKTPGAHAHEEDGKRREGEQVRIDDFEGCPLHEHAPSDRREVRDRVELRPRLDPRGHGLDGRERPGQCREGRVHEEADEL